MTQPAQQPQTAPPAAPAVPQGQPAQQPPSQPFAPPAQPYPTPQAPPGYPPQTAPQQPPAAPPGWLQPPAPGQPPAQPQQPAPQQQPYPAQPGYPMLPAAFTPPPPADPGDDGQTYDLARLPRAAREEIERLRANQQQHTAQLRAASVSQQAWALAPQLGVNPQALVGSLAWQQAAAQLDPAAADYAQRLQWTIQGVLAANPWMAATPANPAPGQPVPPNPPAPPAPTVPPAGPARSGGDFNGAPAAGAQQQIGPGIDRLRHAYSQT
ncbi:hypothetical protein AMIS_2510 [Actinoplanes missouriensis 431]|uniref:Uncharacterized protein n=1 Tax=Actinoplanes missouriensis (strain ATCC 14538 / DSM 43046 / CBS 188.64 / JCM 3121 / NBRC 102363 / NCIMB 12654 / NRRL B-3342 / UNCC 431) TaxID=512565 RepID=I0GXI4_ACTM4|nr:hypothetical protein [Actinoplanes missouriensis]BAL85471.1 hypothetical protein AMIS_2510 [Actinoplanes missouriensis 431]